MMINTEFYILGNKSKYTLHTDLCYLINGIDTDKKSIQKKKTSLISWVK